MHINSRNSSFVVNASGFIFTMIVLLYGGICYLLKYKYQMVLNWYGIIIYVWGITTWRMRTGEKLFSKYFILYTFFVLFNYGICIMWALGIHRSLELGTRYLYSRGFIPNYQNIIDGQWYSCISMILFHIGALIGTKRNSEYLIQVVKDASDEPYNPTERAMQIIGTILTVITTPVAIALRIQEIAIARAYGYRALYYGDYSTQSGYIQILLFFFFPALLCVLIGYRYKKTPRVIIHIIFGLYTILGIMTGDRGSWIYPLIILIYLHSFYKEIKVKQYIFGLLIGIIGIYFLNVVTSVRNTGLEFSLQDFINIFSADESPVVGAFYEMGGSMGIITYFLNTGPQIYPYGNTYLVAILGVVSTRVLTLFGIQPILLANWFSQSYLGITWGTGFSLVGEAYVNGGYFGGFIYVFIWGIIISKLIQYVSKTSLPCIQLFISLASLNILVGFARSTSYLVLKELFYGVVVTLLIIHVIARRN